MKEYFNNKRILIIGGTGSIGQNLVKKLLTYDPKVIRIFSRDEHKQFEMFNDIGDNDKIRFLLGDVRDLDRLKRAMEDIDYVFHVAALKHVPSCEYNPFEAVKTNVIGTQNVIEAAIQADTVKKVIFTSTDKTISPTNTYGATKLLAERLIAAADYYKGPRKLAFSSVRFGNVIGSRGSVIPLFKKQILEKRQITVTDFGMTRFMMTLDQAVNLTLEACTLALGGEVFVLKMPVLRIKDIAEIVIEEVCKKYNIDQDEVNIKKIGIRTGEKMYEELMTLEESKYSLELDHMYAIIPLKGTSDKLYSGAKPALQKKYSSDEQIPISKEDARKLILEQSII